MTYIRLNLIIPQNIYEQGDMPQWEGEVEGNKVEVFYDDDISGVSSQNQYAVFSSKGFHGWLSLGFTMSEILMMVKKEVEDYKKAYDEYQD